MLNSKLRAKGAIEATLATIGRRRLAILSKKPRPGNNLDADQVEADALKRTAEILDQNGLSLAKIVDAYIERLEIEAEVLERLERRLTTEIEQIRAFRTRGEPRLEYDVKADVLKLIKSITQEVKIDAAKGR